MLEKQNDYLQVKMDRSAIEHQEEWTKWGDEAPWLQFPPELEVKIIPPFNGAMVRFRVRFVGGDREISVYWDCHDALGIMDKPYWEIYPVKYKGEDEDYYDTARFVACEEPEMMVAIIKSLMGEYQ